MQQDPRDRFRISRNQDTGYTQRRVAHGGSTKPHSPRVKKASPRLQLKNRIAAIVRQLARFQKQHKKICISLLVLVIILGGIVAARQFFDSESSGSADRTTQQNQEGSGADSAVEVLEKPDFKVNLPQGKSIEDLKVSETRKTPSQDVIFTYRDELMGAQIEVTQQLVPNDQRSNKANWLQEVASNFFLNNVISIDGTITYHGVSESGEQSLATIKGDNVVFIRSPKKLSDDTWVAYITSLK